MKKKLVLLFTIILITLVIIPIPVKSIDITQPFRLPDLPYSYDALEPYIDAETMKIHHTGHHATYVAKLNEAINKYPELKNKTLEELLMNLRVLPKDIQEAVRNNGGGHYNHTLFWTFMGKNKGKEPTGKLKVDIDKSYGSFDNFKKQFKEVALGRFGSGWAWLAKDKGGNLKIFSTPNQDTPIMIGIRPVLGLDVWEHAYYLKYQNKRGDYIDAWWNVVNWDEISKNYK